MDFDFDLGVPTDIRGKSDIRVGLCMTPLRSMSMIPTSSYYRLAKYSAIISIPHSQEIIGF